MKKTKRQKKSAGKAKPSAKKTKRAVAKPAKKVETMDRKALKAVAAQLKDAGVELKVLKSDDDTTLQKKVNDALQKLPPADIVSKLESIDPTKLLPVLQRDCVGLFVDFSDVSCVRCKDVPTCVREFIKNVTGGGIVQLAPAMKTEEKKKPKTEEKKPSADEEETEVELGYEPKRAVFISNVKNKNKKGDDFYDTVQAILDEVPENMKQLRKIIARDFEQDDNEFLESLLSLRDDGIVKLDFDLSDDDKKELRAAGYDV